MGSLSLQPFHLLFLVLATPHTQAHISSFNPQPQQKAAPPLLLGLGVCACPDPKLALLLMNLEERLQTLRLGLGDLSRAQRQES